MYRPFDPEAYEERAAICEYDGRLSRPEAEAMARAEDERRRDAFYNEWPRHEVGKRLNPPFIDND
jgi:hypothetical protein